MKFSLSLTLEITLSLYTTFKSVLVTVNTQLMSQFLEAISLTQEQADMINEKSKSQGETEFWVKQRVGRLTASKKTSIKYVILEKLQIEITN